MGSHSTKIAVSDLKPGMFVEALDRPWLETGFELEGLFLRSPEDIEKLQALCAHVYVTSNEKVPDTESSTLGMRIRPPQHRDNPAHRDRKPRKFAEELKQARLIRDQTKSLVETMHGDIRADRKVNTKGAQQVVTQMMDSVARHPYAMVWFTNLKKRDEYTARHSMNVCMLAITLASFIGADADSIQEMGVGALLHDVGKLKIPLEVLNKPGKLTDAEFALMKKHPELGVQVLHDSPELSPESIEIVLSHHERMNGSGYPRGLAGKQISYYTQLVSIADVYDAMTSDRCYKDGSSPADVLQRMLRFEGDFNPELMDEFVHCIGDYPIGSLVELNTGEVGFVVPAPEKQEKPTIQLVLDHKKRRYFPQRVRDLMRFPKFKVVKVLAAGAYGVDVEDYAEQWS